MTATILGPTVGQHPQQSHRVLFEEGQHLIVEQLHGCERSLHRIQHRESHLRIGVEESLLIDASHPFEGADIEGVLGAQIAGMGGLDLPVQLVEILLLFRAANCLSVKTSPSSATFFSKAFKRKEKVCN